MNQPAGWITSGLIDGLLDYQQTYRMSQRQDKNRLIALALLLLGLLALGLYWWS